VPLLLPPLLLPPLLLLLLPPLLLPPLLLAPPVLGSPAVVPLPALEPPLPPSGSLPEEAPPHANGKRPSAENKALLKTRGFARSIPALWHDFSSRGTARHEALQSLDRFEHFRYE
jgi:hypothetical protein